MKIQIAYAEDNLRFRKAFLRLMENEPDLEFVMVAENGADLLLQLENYLPSIVLLDIRMPVMDGFEAARIIRQKFPTLKIVALTQFDLEENIIEMNRIGVESFISKDEVEDAARILRIVHQGGTYLPEKVAFILRNYLNRMPHLHAKCPIHLSEFEKTLLQSIGKGLNRTEIAEIINKSPRTVEKYRLNLYQKFNVSNHQQLISEASKWSLIK